MNYIIMCRYKHTLSLSLYVVCFYLSVSCTGVARMSCNWSLSVTKFITHIVGGYQNEQPLADKFLEFGKHSYT